MFTSVTYIQLYLQFATVSSYRRSLPIKSPYWLEDDFYFHTFTSLPGSLNISIDIDKRGVMGHLADHRRGVECDH